MTQHETRYGYTADEVSKMRLEDWFGEDEIGIIGDAVKKCFEEGEGHVEAHALTKDGLRIPSYFTTRRLDIGGHRYLVGVGLDITERKHKEKALQESEDRFKSIVSDTEAGYFYIDKDGIIQDVNNARVKMYGYSSAEEIVGEHFAKIQRLDDVDLAHEFVDGIMPLIKEIFEENKNINKWIVIFDIAITSDSTDVATTRKEKIWIDAIGYPILDSEGKLEYVIFQHNEVTDHKQSEEALKTSQTMLKETERVGKVGGWEFPID